MTAIVRVVLGAAPRAGKRAAGGEWIGQSIPRIKIYKKAARLLRFFEMKASHLSREGDKNKMLRGIEPHPL